MLIKTITIETSDDLLFSKESPLLPAATELAFHTVNCSALNAEELRRESGIEVNVKKCVEMHAFSLNFSIARNHSSSMHGKSDVIENHFWSCDTGYS